MTLKTCMREMQKGEDFEKDEVLRKSSFELVVMISGTRWK